MEEFVDPLLKQRSEAEYTRLATAGEAMVDAITDHEGRYNQLLAERGGRIARGFYRIRQRLSAVPGINLVTNSEQSREDRIGYHESRRADPKGIIHDEDLDLTQQEIDSRRLIR